MGGLKMNSMQVGKMHKWLTSMEKYNKELPFYIDNLYSNEEMEELRSIWKQGKLLKPILYGPNEKHDDGHNEPGSRFRPKYAVDMSRMLLEFEMPKNIEEKLDLIAKPLYQDPIALCHYNYIEYNLKYGDGNTNPLLPPHIDGDENLVTLNTNVGGNIDWDLYVDGIRYELPVGKTIVFSAVNSVHWRPKRNFKSGEYLEILSVDYCPIDSYRFLGQMNPIDAAHFPEKRKQHAIEVNSHPRSVAAWKQYNEAKPEN